MATYGSYNGPVKATFDTLTQLTSNGSNTDVTISVPNAGTEEGAKYVTCVVTTTADARIEIGDSSTVTSFLIGAADELICAVASGRVIGVWGVVGTPTVTIRRMIT